MSDVMPQWFGGVFEAAVIVNADQQKQRRLYLEPYTDDQGRDHLLKNASSGSLPAYLEDPPKGDRSKMFSQFNLGLVFRLLDEDLRESLKDTPAGLPGLNASPATYGSTLEIPQEAVAPIPPEQAPTQEGAGALPTRPTASAGPRPTAPIGPAVATASTEPTTVVTVVSAPPGVEQTTLAPTPPPARPPLQRPIAKPIARGRVPTVNGVEKAAAPPEPTASPAAVPASAEPERPAPAGTPPPPGMKPPMRAPGA
jgi:hypothetical protein